MTPSHPALRQAEEIYRRVAFDTFAQDLKMGLNLGSAAPSRYRRSPGCSPPPAG
ncbi:hypothetical protein [Streptomyces sp. NPDC059455]|uniref:hypothetical protein n=1 Tax=Streptomyces sp. NPDC059455 TaxID=3346837 RepID=UPI0036BD3C26